ncbi:Glycosyl transferase family 2 [Rubrobacter radiotolerans]|uniref:Glycosyl transferase family 2 n=2 Tax=Rubrobacter radiotolerans TaxID=42256 RepID=A0A023X307_RUBRA|nr:Glycosyl transferase family 2 [Rubrobacter radiotolerans]SMC04642.1 Glycosyl transferase family 2 [Rubrobacter radiotolerans DSM 5868]
MSPAAAPGFGPEVESEEMCLERQVARDVRHLHGPEEVSYGPDELVLVCLARDGEPWVRQFIERHLKLGVKHVVILDNGSADRTVEIASGYSRVTVLRTTLPFKTHKDAARRYLLKRFGTGRWILYLDIDEVFDYPYSDVVGLGELLRYLTRRAYTAVVTQMLEMFPDRTLTAADGGREDDLEATHRFYDLSDVALFEYPAVLHDRATNNLVSNPEIKLHRGGIQTTLSGHLTIGIKHALVFMDGRLDPVNTSIHWVGNARLADITGLVKHYRFTTDFYERALRAVQEESYGGGSAKYRKYIEALKDTPGLRLRREGARELRNVEQLVEERFLTVSADYLMLMDRLERAARPDGILRHRNYRLEQAFSALRTHREKDPDREKKRRLEEEVRELEGRLLAGQTAVERLECDNASLRADISEVRDSKVMKALVRLARLRRKVFELLGRRG